jgi:hypothetical protein
MHDIPFTPRQESIMSDHDNTPTAKRDDPPTRSASATDDQATTTTTEIANDQQPTGATPATPPMSNKPRRSRAAGKDKAGTGTARHAKPATNTASRGKATPGTEGKGAAPKGTRPKSTGSAGAMPAEAGSAHESQDGRLKPGALRGLVEQHLADHPEQDYTPTALGHLLGRSSGAIANALEKLVADKYAVMVKAKPRTYRSAPPE